MKRTMNRFLLLLFSTIISSVSYAQWTHDSLVNTMIRDTSLSGAGGVTDVKIASLPNGYSYMTWNEAGTGGYRLKIQLVDSNGYNKWSTYGVLLDTLLGSATFRYDLKTDKEGNAIVAAQDQRSTTNNPVVFKVDTAGNQPWGPGGIQLTDTMATSGLSPVIGITDSNYVIVAWSASGTKSFVSCQKISPAGTFRWADNMRIRDAVSTKKYERPKIVLSSGEDIVMQYVERTGFGLGVSTMYAQRYDGEGTAIWTAPTQVSSKTIGFAYFPNPIPDGYGGFFLSFTSGNPSSPAVNDVFAQRIYADGHKWSPTGIELATGASQHKFEAGAVYITATNNYYAGIRFTSSSQGAAGVALQALDTAGNLLLTTTAKEIVPLSASTNADIINVTNLREMDTALVFLYRNGSAPDPIIIKAVKVDHAGNYLWADTTTLVSVAQSDKAYFDVGTYNYGQIVATWMDKRTSNGGVYAQNILSDGSLGINCADVTLDTFAAICVDSAAITLTQGWPAGGIYSGPGVSNGVFSPANAGLGTHTIQYVYNFVSCTDTVTQTITVFQCTLGIGTVSSNDLFSCYPNPANDQVSIVMKGEAADISAKIVDMNGKVLWADQQYGKAGVYKKSIDLSRYAKGMYLLIVNSSAGSATTKLIVQ